MPVDKQVTGARGLPGRGTMECEYFLAQGQGG
jgi:hypothetical protein